MLIAIIIFCHELNFVLDMFHPVYCNSNNYNFTVYVCLTKALNNTSKQK